MFMRVSCGRVSFSNNPSTICICLFRISFLSSGYLLMLCSGYTGLCTGLYARLYAVFMLFDSANMF